jgi:hypothetical protein
MNVERIKEEYTFKILHQEATCVQLNYITAATYFINIPTESYTQCFLYCVLYKSTGNSGSTLQLSPPESVRSSLFFCA